jgi:hypothetical protein
MTASRSNLESLQRWYETYEGRGIEPAEDLIDELFDPEVEFSPWLAREVERRTFHGHEAVGQDLGLVYEFRGGLVKRLTAFGSHEEAVRAAKEKQHAQA